MKSLTVAVLWVLYVVAPVVGQNSRLLRADGETIFAEEFLDDLRAAEASAVESKSAQPLLGLLDKYKKPEELAELELTLGIVYTLRTGLVNPAQAVPHLTNALGYELPETVRLQAIVWRAGSYFQLREDSRAIRDYLRALLMISVHDLNGSPEIKNPTLQIYTRSEGPENEERRRDYSQYRRQLDLERLMAFGRYSVIENLKEATKRAGTSEAQLRSMLKEINPDERRGEIVMQWLKSENKRPEQ
jgi:hypothetical protein